jgi:hypothetical protein
VRRNSVEEVKSMKKLSLLSVVMLAAAIISLSLPNTASAQGENAISVSVIEEGAFVTVSDSMLGDVISLYRIRGDRIILVDVVINSVKQSSMSIRAPKRYLHRVEVENK